MNSKRQLLAVVALMLVAGAPGTVGVAWGQCATELQKVTAADAAADDEFGYGVSLSGDTAIVGANQFGSGGWGSAYIYQRDLGGPDNWGQAVKLTPSDAAAGDYFGRSVSLSGNTAIVGAYGNDDDGSTSGSAYIYQRDFGGSDNWGQVAKLTASDAVAGARFGFTVSLSGDTAIVGAVFDSGGSGSAYIFQRDFGGPGNWGQVVKITAADASANDNFSISVSLSADTAIVGAYKDDDDGSDSGSAYIFQRDFGGPGNWGQVVKLTAFDAAAVDEFGITASLSGDTAIVGAHADDDDGNLSGSAYIFQRDFGGPDNWGQVVKLTASDGAVDDFFGLFVSISANTAIVGARGNDDAGNRSGSAYLYGLPIGCDPTCQSAKMYWTDSIAQTISRADLDGTDPEVLFDLTSVGRVPNGLALDVQENRIYWTWSINSQAPGGISYGSMDGGAIVDLPDLGLGALSALALDLTNGMMYWTEWDSGMVRRALLDGSCVQDVDGPLGVGISPSSIALDVANDDYYHGAYRFADPASNMIFFGEREPNCLGTGWAGPIRILEEVGPIGMALDLRPTRRHIYWTMWPGPGLTGGKIQRCDLDGTNRITLPMAGLDGLTGITLDVDRNHMYFAEGFPQGTSIKRANLDGSGLIDITPPGLTSAAVIALDLRNLDEPDCNGNGIPDSCDIASGASQDIDGDGVPDECNPPAVCPPSGQPFFTETYQLTGPATGTPWSWCIRFTDPALPDLCELNAPGVFAGGSLEVAMAFAESINAARDARGCTPEQLDAQALEFLGSVLLSVTAGGDAAFELWVGAAGSDPNCEVLYTNPNDCVINPTIVEVPLPGNDCNGNGWDDVIDNLVCPGDADGDRDVDISDLGLLLSEFGAVGCLAADLDLDQDVDITDLGMLLSAFGSVCP